LSVSHNSTISSVNTRKISTIAITRLESSILSAAGSVIGTTNTIKGVSTPVSSTGSVRITDLQAKLITTHEAKKGVGQWYNTLPGGDVKPYLFHSVTCRN